MNMASILQGPTLEHLTSSWSASMSITTRHLEESMFQGLFLWTW
jgi:hypothetical protein